MMKNLTLFMLFLISLTQYGLSQSVTGTVTQVPCNNDGIYDVTTSGIPLPITYTYYVNGTMIVHPNVNSTTDQLTNIAMSNYGYIYCEASNGSVTAYTQDSYTASFVFDVTTTSPLCPVTMWM